MENEIHYVIIYANMNVLAGDRIAVAIVFVAENNNTMFIAVDKLESAKDLFSLNAFDIVKDFINEMQKKSQTIGSLVTYIENLSKQCNNLITLTKLTPISIEPTHDNMVKFANTYLNTPQ